MFYCSKPVSEICDVRVGTMLLLSVLPYKCTCLQSLHTSNSWDSATLYKSWASSQPARTSLKSKTSKKGSQFCAKNHTYQPYTTITFGALYNPDKVNRQGESVGYCAPPALVPRVHEWVEKTDQKLTKLNFKFWSLSVVLVVQCEAEKNYDKFNQKWKDESRRVSTFPSFEWIILILTNARVRSNKKAL